MKLCNVTLAKPAGIQCAIFGNFSGPKAQELVVSRGKVLELLRPDNDGRVQVIYSTEIFGVIRGLQPFRLTGGNTDYIIVGSDSGRVVILRYDKEKSQFIKIHQETFGKSGCRRIVPGQFLAVDPKGRACMIAAVEKQKFVYVLNRDSAANLTISSPLEAHKSHTLVFDIVGLDQGFDNPQFAALELDYADADQDPTGEAALEAQKHLTYYELDLGLNHVVRRASEPIENGANMLVAVPGGGDGPGGVLVCAENFVVYRGEDTPEELRVVIPRRNNLPGDRGVLIVAHTMYKQKTQFLCFLQSEYGDLYRVHLVYEGTVVKEMVMQYFDTIPTAASICLMKKGFLFAASEFGNHALYQFMGLGGDEDEGAVKTSSTQTEAVDGEFAPVFFEPRPLTNLAVLDKINSLCPIMDVKVANLLFEEIPQIYAACGRGPQSTLRVLRPGLAVTELAVSPLPGNPTAVFTVKQSNAADYDSYIVVSFANATLVLSIGETVEEVQHSGFQGTVPTMRTQLLADDSMLQVHPGGLRHIKPDGRVNEWRNPARRNVVRVTANEYQVVVGLSGGELLYFELNASGELLEMEKRETGSEIVSLDVPPVQEGRQRSNFLAVGLQDNTVRILSLKPDDPLKNLATQALPATPDSVLLLDSPAVGAKGTDEGAGEGVMFLHIGLANGTLLRTEIDRVTGNLTDPRTRFLGTRSPRLFPLTVRGGRASLCLSSRPWLGYSDMGRYNLVPMSYETLDYAAGFSSEQCPEAIVAVANSSLRILTIDRLGELFNQQSTRLRYTPRKLQISTAHKLLYVAECDHAAIPLAQREDLDGVAIMPEAMAVDGEGANGDAPHANGVADINVAKEQGPEFDPATAELMEQWGAPKGAPGQWAACVRVVDPRTLETKHVVELVNNEAVTSMCLASFSQFGDAGQMLVVGTARSMTFSPRNAEGGTLRVYQLIEGGSKLELLHETPVDGIPGAVVGFKGRLLAGVGDAVRLYDCGKKKLLRKAEYRKLPNFVATLNVSGNRIYVGDLQEGFFYLKYKKAENKLYAYAEVIGPRYITTALNLDYDTMAGADKFGNFFINRLPVDISAQVEEDPTGGKLVAGPGEFHKLQNVCNFHVGDIVTSLQKASLVAGGQEAIIYATMMGSIGVLLPFTSKGDVDLFEHLEMHMRQEHPPLCGRDHIAFRSYYWPVKDCVDGDLCEQYAQIPHDKQRAIADDIDRTPGEIMRRIEELRNKVM